MYPQTFLDVGDTAKLTHFRYGGGGSVGGEGIRKTSILGVSGTLQ